MTGTLFVIAAPSGAGKTSLVKAVVDATEKLKVSVSHTTRARRSNEKEGVDYHFVSMTEFEKCLSNDIFLEHATVFGHYYGTSREWVMEQLNLGIDVILEIDWQGAQQVRRLFPESISVFILPPSLAVLKERLQGRQQDDSAVIQARLAAATNEISHYKEFDYLIVNDVFATALTELQQIIYARRLRLDYQEVAQAGLLAQLLINK